MNTVKPPERTEHCDTCRFAEKVYVPGNIHPGYQCHRFPPTIPLPGPGGQGLYFAHPTNGPDNWCGEYAAAQPPLQS